MLVMEGRLVPDGCFFEVYHESGDELYTVKLLSCFNKSEIVDQARILPWELGLWLLYRLQY